MLSKRFSAALLALMVVAVAIPAAATAAKAPKFYVYKKCSTKTLCQYYTATNSANTKIVSLQVGPKCSKAGSTFYSYNQKQISIKDKKFSGELLFNSYDKGQSVSNQGKIKVSGKVTKKDKVKVNYEIDGTVAPGCSNITKGSVTIKYFGSQSGG